MTVSTNLAHNRYIRQTTRHTSAPTLARVLGLGADLQALFDAVIPAFAVLGGTMAAVSGSEAALAYWRRKPRMELAHAINEGIAFGFTLGAPLAILALIMSWA